MAFPVKEDGLSKSVSLREAVTLVRGWQSSSEQCTWARVVRDVARKESWGQIRKVLSARQRRLDFNF